MMGSVLKAAVVQVGSVMFDRQKTITKVAAMANAAAARGAQLAVFPEALIGGYPKGLDFGARVGSRTEAGREQFRRYFEDALQVPGEASDQIGEIAQQNKLYLVIGVVEREAGTLYCTALFFGPDGSLLGKHRKVMPTAAERLIWGYGDGSTLSVFDTPIGKLGAVICWENYMPLLRMAMYGRGVQIYCALTVDDRDTWLPSMRHIAAEGRCFVLSACQYLEAAAGSSGDVAIRGGSCIVNPLGGVLAGPDFSGESVLVAELDLAEIPRGKYDLDVTGHYARPDIFQLTVDERRRRVVDFSGEPA